MRKKLKSLLAIFIAVTCVLPIQGIAAKDGVQIDAIRNISRNDGGGMYGTHREKDYVEDGVQYYRDGDIIQVDIVLPKDHGTQAAQQVVKYDSSKLDLLSSNRDIENSLASNLIAKSWTTYVGRLSGDTEKVHIYGSVSNWRDVETKDFEGGSFATVYFRVKNGVESEAGTPIEFDFPQFQLAENIDGKLIYTHLGYDPDHDAETAYYHAPKQTIYAKKPSLKLQAQDGFIKQSDAKALGTASDLKAYNNVSAGLGDGTTVSTTVAATEFSAIKAGTLGSYDVTYSATYNGVTKNEAVKLNVIQDDAVISPDDTFALYADDTFITASDAKKLTNKESLIPLNKATVLLANGNSATPVVATSSFANIQSGKIGNYKVQYSYGTGSNEVTKDVSLNVVKDGSVISPNNDASLYANDGFIKQSKAKALANKEGLIPYNEAEVTLKDGSKVAPNVSISGTEWLAVKDGIVGSYNVLYQYGNGANEISNRVKINVIDDDSEISEDKKASLTAKDAEISVTEAKALTTKNDLIEINKASVQLVDGSKATPVVTLSNFSDIQSGKIGTYSITYSYGTGTSKVSKNVTLEVVEDKKHEIVAKDSMINQSQARALSSKDELRNVNDVKVTAIDGSHPNAVVTTNDWEDIKAGKLGTYVITYSYGYGDKLVSTTARVTITKDGSIIGENGSIYAKNGFIEQSKAKKLKSKEDLISINDAEVTLLDGTKVKPNVGIATAKWLQLVDGDLGSYSIEYSNGSGANILSTEVVTTVIKDGSIISENGEVSLFAKDGFITAKEAGKLTNKNELAAFNDAKVVLVDGTEVNATVSVSATDWLAIRLGTIGSYDVLYTYGSGSREVEKLVKIVVIDDDSEISENGKVSLSVKDGEISDKDAKALLDKKELIPYNEAKVIFSDGTAVEPEVAISSSSFNDIKNGKLGTYTVVYYYGVEGTSDYVSKTVTLEVVKKTEDRYLFDYDNNGRVDVLDLADFKIVISNQELVDETTFILSDSNGDNRIDIADLSDMQYYLSNPDILPPIVQVPIK